MGVSGPWACNRRWVILGERRLRGVRAQCPSPPGPLPLPLVPARPLFWSCRPRSARVYTGAHFAIFSFTSASRHIRTKYIKSKIIPQTEVILDTNFQLGEVYSSPPLAFRPGQRRRFAEDFRFSRNEWRRPRGNSCSSSCSVGVGMLAGAGCT